MNLNTPSIKQGPLVAHDFDTEPWHLPQWAEQSAAERGYHEAAHAATGVGVEEDTRTIGDAILDWMTPRRFWTLYPLTLVSVMLAVWVVLS